MMLKEHLLKTIESVKKSIDAERNMLDVLEQTLYDLEKQLRELERKERNHNHWLVQWRKMMCGRTELSGGAVCHTPFGEMSEGCDVCRYG